MTAGKSSGETERPRCLLLVSLSTTSPLEGFEPGKWTIVEAFAYEEEARLRLHQIREFLTELQARALVLVSADSRLGTTAAWSVAARFNSSVTHITPDNATQVSPQASATWAEATRSFSSRVYVLAPSTLTNSSTRNSKTRSALIVPIAAALVAGIGIEIAFWRSPVQIKVDAKTEFARQGGVFATIPDKDHPDWYVRLRFNPDGTKDILDRFPARDLEYRRGKNDREAVPVEFLNSQLNGIAASFRPKS